MKLTWRSAALSLALPDQHARLADGAVPGAWPAGHAGRHSGRRARSPGRHGLRLDLVPERLADRAGRAARLAQPTRSGGASSRRRCRTCARTTSPAPASPSPATRSTTSWAATRRWPVCASGSARAACGCCSISSPTTRAWIIPGSRTHPEYYIQGTERRPGARAAELHAGQARAAATCVLRLRPRSVLRRLAGHAAAQLRAIPPRRRR